MKVSSWIFMAELPFPLWMTGSVSPIIWPGVCDVCFYPGLQRVLHRIRCKQGGSWVPQTTQRNHCRLWWGNVLLLQVLLEKKLFPFLLFKFYSIEVYFELTVECKFCLLAMELHSPMKFILLCQKEMLLPWCSHFSQSSFDGLFDVNSAMVMLSFLCSCSLSQSLVEWRR